MSDTDTYYKNAKGNFVASFEKAPDSWIQKFLNSGETLSDVQRLLQWDIGINNMAFKNLFVAQIGNMFDYWPFVITDVRIGGYTINSEPHASTRQLVVSTVTPPKDVILTIRETGAMFVYRYMYWWWRRIYNPNTKLFFFDTNPITHHRRNINIYLLRPDNDSRMMSVSQKSENYTENMTCVLKINLNNCIISSLPEINLSYKDGNPIEYQIGINVERVFMEPYQYEYRELAQIEDYDKMDGVGYSD